jgi:UbiD family decarboxylase
MAQSLKVGVRDERDGAGLLGADLRELLAALAAGGDVRAVDGADWDLELGAITELMALRDGPALLFDRIKGYPAGYRVLSNLINSPRRVAQLLGLGPEVRGVALVRAIKEQFRQIELTEPVEVAAAPWQAESWRGAAVDLLRLPSPRWHEHDGGRYLGTAVAVVTRDRDSGWVNVGTYRVQVHDERTLGLFVEPTHHAALIRQRYWDAGEACPIAVGIGVPTAVLLGSFLGVPWGTSEYAWAGGLAGQPVAVVRGPVTGLPLPASAEIVIEGYSPPPEVEARTEGPFGETTGYYASGAADRPVIRVEALSHRADPILVSAPPLRPPASSSASYLFRAANIWSEIDRLGLPDVRGVWQMPAGSSYFLTVISLKQRYGGHAKQVAQAAMAGRAGGGNLGRFVIVVDDDIDPADEQQVLWALSTRCDPERGIDVIRDCASGHLDPIISPAERAQGRHTGARAILNACKPFGWLAQFPRDVGTSPELQEQVLRVWPELFGGEASRPNGG